MSSFMKNSSKKTPLKQNQKRIPVETRKNNNAELEKRGVDFTHRKMSVCKTKLKQLN